MLRHAVKNEKTHYNAEACISKWKQNSDEYHPTKQQGIIISLVVNNCTNTRDKYKYTGNRRQICYYFSMTDQLDKQKVSVCVFTHTHTY